MWAEAARGRHGDDGRSTPGDMTDAEWQTIEPVPRGYATLSSRWHRLARNLEQSPAAEDAASIADRHRLPPARAPHRPVEQAPKPAKASPLESNTKQGRSRGGSPPP